MRSIVCEAVITSISSKADRSVGLRVATPELTVEEKTLFFELQNVPVDIIITPKTGEAPEFKVQKDLNQKTPAQRLRNVLFILWKESRTGIDFEVFYKNKMEAIIEEYKEQIEG